jgi:hypothetical protein
MNRFQYNNAIVDLFQLNVVVFPLPERMLREHGGYFQPHTGKMPDQLKVGSRPLGKSQLIERRLAGVTPFPQDLRAEHGFDNRGDHLTLSPILLESFLRLSRSIVESADFNDETCGIWSDFFSPPREENVETAVVLEQRLRVFLTRAFRRGVEDDLLDRYVRYALSQMDDGKHIAGCSVRRKSRDIETSPTWYSKTRGRCGADWPHRTETSSPSTSMEFALSNSRWTNWKE